MFAGCLFPEGPGALSLQSQSSRNLKILKLDVTSDEDVQLAKKIVQENLPERGERMHEWRRSVFYLGFFWVTC